MSRLIELNGKFGVGLRAIIDDEDYEKVSSLRWKADHRGYVYTNMGSKRVYLHRFISELDEFDGVILFDHRNGNRLDNQKHNLRKCTNSQNQANTKSWENKDSKGVYFFNNRWVARIMVDGNRKYLGRYESKQEAIDKYNEASIMYFGDFSYQNRYA
jgi:hypothetical protein